MALGAQYSKGPGMLANPGLQGRAQEIYDALCARHSGAAGAAGEGRHGESPLPARRGGAVQHDALAAEAAPAGGAPAGLLDAPPVLDVDLLEAADAGAEGVGAAAGAGAAGALPLGARVEDHGLDMGKCLSMHQARATPPPPPSPVQSGHVSSIPAY